MYGLWRTRGSASLGQYLKGDSSIRWATIGLSVLATQAGPITFLSMPGQTYESGIGFIQNYFGQPLALIVVCAVFVPIYQRLKVYTAYQYLGQRFDRKTQLLGAFLFLVQRGIAAGITIYAPAIILSTLLGWRLDLTIWLAGGLVIIYTVAGGTKIVSITQRYQMIVILIGMAIAFAVAVYRLSSELSFGHALSVAGKMGKLEAVDFSFDPHKRYTFWSGLIGGFFLALSYFGADQSQVQRYLAGGSLKESRFGLLFNAVVKVPMQFFILLLGAVVFMFYQFEKPPVYFNQPAYERAIERGYAPQLAMLQTQFDDVFEQKRAAIRAISNESSASSSSERDAAMARVRELDARAHEVRNRTKSVLEQAGADPKSKESDYVFITFILKQMPHGLVGLLIAVILCATMSATAATLNALGSTTAIDFYRPLIRTNASDHHYVVAAKALTAA
ncbi:MAG: sodium:solute symporter, partial [Verrucomicrobia bacterium]